MDRSLTGLATALFSGVIFGFGLALARMTDPQKIKDFLDLAAIPAGGWDPSLAFVMGGGVIVFFIGYRLADRLRRPIAALAFSRPDRVAIDRPLIVGAALFGVGWGISGFCPGPAIADLGLVPGDVILFVAAMFAGSWAVGLITSAAPASPPAGARAT